MTVDCNDPAAELPDGTTTCRVRPDEAPSLAVVRAVAAASGLDPVGAGTGTDSLEPLAESIDPEALDCIVESGCAGPGDTVSIEFSYADHLVTVRGGETVCVTVD